MHIFSMIWILLLWILRTAAAWLGWSPARSLATAGEPANNEGAQGHPDDNTPSAQHVPGSWVDEDASELTTPKQPERGTSLVAACEAATTPLVGRSSPLGRSPPPAPIKRRAEAPLSSKQPSSIQGAVPRIHRPTLRGSEEPPAGRCGRDHILAIWGEQRRAKEAENRRREGRRAQIEALERAAALEAEVRLQEESKTPLEQQSVELPEQRSVELLKAEVRLQEESKTTPEQQSAELPSSRTTLPAQMLATDGSILGFIREYPCGKVGVLHPTHGVQLLDMASGKYIPHPDPERMIVDALPAVVKDHILTGQAKVTDALFNGDVEILDVVDGPVLCNVFTDSFKPHPTKPRQPLIQKVVDGDTQQAHPEAPRAKTPESMPVDPRPAEPELAADPEPMELVDDDIAMSDAPAVAPSVGLDDVAMSDAPDAHATATDDIAMGDASGAHATASGDIAMGDAFGALLTGLQQPGVAASSGASGWPAPVLGATNSAHSTAYQSVGADLSTAARRLAAKGKMPAKAATQQHLPDLDTFHRVADKRTKDALHGFRNALSRFDNAGHIGTLQNGSADQQQKRSGNVDFIQDCQAVLAAAQAVGQWVESTFDKPGQVHQDVLGDELAIAMRLKGNENRRGRGSLPYVLRVVKLAALLRPSVALLTQSAQVLTALDALFQNPPLPDLPVPT